MHQCDTCTKATLAKTNKTPFQSIWNH